MGSDALLTGNRRFYDRLWSGARLIEPDRFNTWRLVQALSQDERPRLELGAGLRPRLPIRGTVFADISLPALRPLQGAGGRAVAAMATALPFADGVFGLVCAMDVVEHVAEDELALSELARVSAPGAALLLSVPLHAAAWSGFDEAVGHHRRYEPAGLVELLATAGFTIEASARSGMLPRSRRLRDAGAWFLRHQHERAMWWYNHVFMPIGLRRAAPLVLATGLMDLHGIAGVLLLCRRA
jgi:SAM-dependent methyltransferase